MKTITTDTGDSFDIEVKSGDVVLSTYDTETDASAGFALYPREARLLARKLLKAADKAES